jgi:TP901 family phage tail tape measure protein
MTDMKLGIELVLKGAEQVSGGIKAVKQAVSNLGQEFRAGMVSGMQDAVREAQRPLNDLKKMADEARTSLNIRSEIDIEGDINQARKAYDDLKASGQATAGELNRAKDSMKKKIGELRVEMGKWSGDWEDLGKKTQDYGAKLQGIGTKAMIAGAPAFLAGKASIEAERDLLAIANTAGLLPEAAAKAAAGWKAQLNDIARITNQTQSDLAGALGALVSKGMDPDQALKMLRPIGDAATATGGQISDIARTLFSTYDNLKTPIAEASKTLDILATAGNRGAFELKDMAQYFPQLSAAAGMLKMQGVEASASLAAAAQISMKGAGDASTAANNLQNFLLKLTAPDTAQKFKDAGVNISAEMKKGVESGDLIGYMAGLVEKMTGGDAEKVSQLFGDQQVKMFLAPMLQNMGEYREIRQAALAAVGTVEQQKNTILAATSEKLKNVTIGFAAAMDESKVFQTALEGIKKTAEWFAANPEVFGVIATGFATVAVGGVGLSVAAAAFTGVGAVLGIIAAAGPALVLAAPAIASIVGVIAAWKVSFAFGTWISEQIDWMVQAITGDKFATLGTVLYDSLEGPQGLITFIKGVPDKLAGVAERWGQVGAELIQSLKDGFTAGLKGELGIGAKLTSAIAYIKTTAKEWYAIGTDMMDGLWKGIQATIRKPLDAIGDLAKKLPEWAKDLLGIKSPSRVFMEIGENVGAGMVLGIDSSLPNVKAAAEKLAEMVVVDPAGAPRTASGKFKSSADAAAQGTGYGGGINEYVASIKTASDTIKDVTVRAFQGMEDALTGFVKTGKLDFKSMADSIISDMIRMQIQQSVTKPLAAAFAGFNLGSLFPFAQGGTPGGTSAWRNQIVDKPTLFAFAKGGVMGEAGPEAIMPLARGPDGTLGVRSSGSGSNVKVIINNNSGTKATTQERTDGNGGRIIEVFLEQIDARFAGGISRGASATSDAIERTYGLNRVAGAY